ncbi:hypothetical protein P872_12615 [Rhodonellum psychrophilum GCM71 = DSM 17998]|uniref:Uncharacterized protein n=1 Tax=Rhodonellum psychrophilum GCM71 = DSM 17998 TaxID=1123057 RepID=U5BJJ6_9BACT|nr:hypothetical protein P872_12615 [Rhodonellum psychrophilum GCM71 = DSM 17998]
MHKEDKTENAFMIKLRCFAIHHGYQKNTRTFESMAKNKTQIRQPFVQKEEFGR